MDGVLLITYVRAAMDRARGRQPGRDLVRAVSQRLRPVLMTALLARWAPAGGGVARHRLGHAAALRHRHHRRLISSTLLTMLLLPTLYELFDRWFGTGLQRRRAARGVA